MASVQLYTQNATEGLQTYTLAEANLLEATKDTHYTQDFLYKTTNPTTQEDVWTVNLSIPLAGMDYVSPNKNYQPLPHYPLIDHNGYFYPDYVDPAAEALTEEPTDWELHWRDYYSENKFVYWDYNLKRYYYGAPLYPNASNVPPTWVSGVYYKTNQVRHIYWTMDGNYFPLTWGWLDIGNTVYYGLQFAWAQYGKYNVNWDAHWENVNNPRFAGVSGPLVYGNSGNGENYFSFVHNYGAHTSLTSDIDPRVYFNFIGFKYKFMDTTGTEPVEKTEEFIGLIAWEESIDGIPQSAKIVGLSKNFFGARKKPANGGPISGIQGGNGVFDAPSNNHGDRTGTEVGSIVNGWSASASNVNFFNMYYISSAFMSAFKSEFITSLWNPSWLQTFLNSFVNPMDAIIQCHVMPSGLLFPYYGADEEIQVANILLSTTKSPTFGNMYHMKHIGSIDITEYTGSFADYTNCSIYINLPYVGVKQIDTAACMNGWVSVDYATDVLSGDCTAFVSVCDRFGNTQIRYEWKGNCSRDVPLKQRDNPLAKTVMSALPSIAGLTAGLATGSAATALFTTAAGNSIFSSLSALDPYYGLFDQEDADFIAQNLPSTSGISRATNIASTIASSATNALVSGQSILSNNASGAGVSSPINTNCYLYITRPQWSNPVLYERQKAYPSDISGKIGDFNGFLSAQTAELNNIDCTDVERSEIMTRLVAGVYLS